MQGKKTKSDCLMKQSKKKNLSLKVAYTPQEEKSKPLIDFFSQCHSGKAQSI